MNEMDIMMAEDRMAALEERTAEEIAQSINRIKAEVRETVLEGSIRIGQELRAAKSVVPYGEWGTWLETNVDYSVRTAQNLMRIADEYGQRRTEAMEGLSITQAVALLGLPADVRAEYVETHDMESMTTDALKEEIAELRDKLAGSQQTIDSLMAQAHAPAQDDTELEDLRRKLREAEARAEAAQETAQAAKAGEAAAEAAKAEARKASQEAAELRTKLAAAQQSEKALKLQKERTEEELLRERQKPAKVEYQTPPEVEAELAKLREAAGRSEDEVVLRTMYKGVTDAFTRLEEQLKLVRGKDAQLGQKMGAAFAAALRKMAEVIGG